MSIEGIRDALQLAREDLVAGKGHAEEGRATANEVFSKFAETEGYRSRMLGEADSTAELLHRAVASLRNLSGTVNGAASLQGELMEVSSLAKGSFSEARRHGKAARTKLTEALGEEQASEYGPCVEHSGKAAGGALRTAMGAAISKDQLEQCASELIDAAREIGRLVGGVDILVEALGYTDLLPSDLAEILTAGGKVEQGELRARAADNPSISLEHGVAATTAFGTAIQSVDDRLGRL